MLVILPLVVLASLTSVAEAVCLKCPVVEVQQGRLRGTHLTSVRSRKRFLAFLGVPYAKPPLGNLRFKDPLPAEPWRGIRDARSEGPMCMQKQVYLQLWLGTQIGRFGMGSDDCLFLNIYTPKISADEELKPVMVFFHGGAFYFGSGSRILYAPDFFMDHDVVLVTLNYRLGPLGFLDLDIEEAPGNAGLKDQVMALRWIQDNIIKFGGDPRRVTIFGESAGSASVEFHMMSPKSRGLFQQAICQSGSALNWWAFTPSTKNMAFKLGSKLGFPTNDTMKLLRFLQSVDSRKLVVAADDMFTLEDKPCGFRNPFIPTLDLGSRGGPFLASDPAELLKKGYFQKVPYISGSNSQEAALYLLFLRSLPNGMEMLHRKLERILPQDFPIPNSSDVLQEITSKIKNFYSLGDKPSDKKVQQMSTMLTYVQFAKDIQTSIEYISSYSSPTYFYHFTFNGPWGVLKPMMGNLNIKGVAHTDELAYLFRNVFTSLYIKPSEKDAALTSERMLKLWTNFAWNGNPTPIPDGVLNVTWIPFSKDSQHYLRIDKDLSMNQNLYSADRNFWKGLYELAATTAS